MSELFICHIFYSNNFSHGQIALNIDICCFVKYCSWFKKRQKWQVCGKCVAGVGGRCVAVGRFSVAMCPVCLSERAAGV